MKALSSKYVVVAAAFAALMMSACKKAPEKPRDEAVPVTVAAVEQRDVPITIAAIGNVEPFSTVSVRAQVSGVLQSVGFHEGDEVRKGQLLFVIDPRPLQAELAQAQAALARDEAQLRNASAQAARYADLVKKDYVTREEYDRIAAAAESARATVAADRAAVENARVQLSYTSIHSPMNGRTGSLMVHPGNLVRANDTTPLVVINQIAPIRVTFSVPQSNLGAITAAGRHLDVRAAVPQGGEERGTLSFVDNAVNQSTGTVTLKATFDNAHRALWPGQFVNVTMALSNRAAAIVIPSRAVQNGQRGTYVYVVKGDKQVEMRPIKVDQNIAQETIVAKGLTAGETVVTDGQLRLTPKSKVSIKTDLVPQKGSAS